MLIASKLNEFVNNSINNKKELKSILFVPKDNRPASTYYNEKIAKIAGIKLIMPPKEILGEKKVRGDVEKIEKWVYQNADKADIFIISATMLNHGGLMHSRNFVPKYYNKKEYDFKLIKKLKERYPKKKIYVYDIIQRLAVSLWSKEDEDNYYNIMKWAELKDKAENFNDENAKKEIKKLESIIPEKYLKGYKTQRKLNHDLKLKMIDLVNEGYIDYLIFSQGDAAKYGVHRIEQKELQNKINGLNLNDKIKIICGADEIDMSLLALLINEKYNTITKFSVHYADKKQKIKIYPYEDRPLKQTIKEHIEWFGGKLVKENADIKLYVYSPVDDKTIIEFVNKIKKDINDNKLVAIIDLSKLEDKVKFMKVLDKETDLSKLVTYVGWNTTSNTVGIAISHATAYHKLNKKNNLGHYNFLYERLIRDFIYDAIVKEKVAKIIASKGIDRWNIKDEELKAIENVITNEIQKEEKKWFLDDFKKVNLIPVTKKVTLPWNRLFDTVIDIEIKKIDQK